MITEEAGQALAEALTGAVIVILTVMLILFVVGLTLLLIGIFQLKKLEKVEEKDTVRYKTRRIIAVCMIAIGVVLLSYLFMIILRIYL